MAGNCAHNYNNIDFNVLRRKPDRHVSERRRKCSSTGGYEQIWNAVSVDHVYWIAAIYDQSGILQYPSRMRRDCSAYEGGSYCSTCESCIQLSSYLWQIWLSRAGSTRSRYCDCSFPLCGGCNYNYLVTHSHRKNAFCQRSLQYSEGTS